MMSTKKNFGKLALMIIITFISQLLVLSKSSIVAGLFGAGNEMDAYNVAVNIASFVFSFVLAGISTIVIPEYVKKQNSQSVDTFITVVFGAVAVLVAVMVLLRYQIAEVFTNRDGFFEALTAYFLVILLVSQMVSSFANVTVAYFQCEGKYNVPKIIQLVSQIGVVAALIFFKDLSVKQYAWIVAAGVGFSALIDGAIAVKNGFRYKPRLVFDQHTKELFKCFLPIVLSSGVSRLSLMIDSTIASFLDTGRITVLSYSSQISTMIDAVIVGNLVLYIYPKITKQVQDGVPQEKFWKQTAAFHTVTCLVIAGYICVGAEAVDLLFEHGSFTSEAGKLLFTGSAIYVFGHQLGIIRDLIYRYFYANGNTKTPATNSIIVSIVNIVVSLILVKLIGFYGIIIGTVLASAVSLTLALTAFRRKISFCAGAGKSFVSCLMNFIAMAATVALVYLTKTALPLSNSILAILVYGCETVAVYGGLTFLLNRRVISNFRAVVS